MNRTFASLASLVLLCSLLAGCPSEPATGGDAGRDAASVTPDTGPAPSDTGPAPSDTGPAPSDTGPAPSDTGVTADTGPVADSGPAVDAGPTTGACTNPADAAALPMSFMGMDIGGHTAACAPGCIGSMAGAARTMCVNDCLQGPTRINGAISTACTTCFAQAADCTIANCLTQCIASSTAPACITCQCTNCAAATAACSGIPDSRCPAP